jgi:hypothetical protein
MPKKNYSFGHIHEPGLFRSDDLAAGVQEKLEKLEAIFVNAKSQTETIRNSGEFTAKGKQNAIAELRKELEKQLRDWHSFVKHYDDQIGQLKNSMQPTEHRRDDVVYALEQREIRDYLRQLDPLELESFVREAAANGDDRILSAVSNSPISFKLATAGLINKIASQRLEAQYPTEAGKMKDLMLAQEQVGSALKSVHAELARVGLERLGEDRSFSTAA